MAGGLLTSGLLDCWKIFFLQKIPWRIHGIGKIAYIYAIKIQNLGKTYKLKVDGDDDVKRFEKVSWKSDISNGHVESQCTENPVTKLA